MEKLIKDIIEVDKIHRAEVDALMREKEKINDFIREEKKRLKTQLQNASKSDIMKFKADIALDLKNKKQEAITESEAMLAKLESSFKKNKETWIDDIYDYCIQNK
ncbi:MAG: hypothetical protein WC251_02220 [Candidatus Izemoplasmatales bacterium]|jgi:hypothetical protein|nr:hypothetical protein [Candidatus Izemoplasmatales bacterium]